MKQKKFKKLFSVSLSVLLVIAMIQAVVAFSASAASIESGAGFSASELCPDGNHTFSAWKYVNKECHSRTCSACSYVENGSHVGGEASCYTKAVCSLCDSEYGDPSTVKIELQLTEASLEVGRTLKMKVFQTPDDIDETITWTSSKPEIASVSKDGVVTAVAKGKAVITGVGASGGKVTANITVIAPMKAPTSSITINQPSVMLVMTNAKPAPTASLSAKIVGGSTGKVWYSDNPSVATVTKSGKVTAISEGTANIYCRTADNTVSAPSKVTVKTFAIQSPNMTTFSSTNTIYVNQGASCTFSLNDTVGYGDVTWTWSSAKVATMSGNKLTGLVKGTGTLTVMTADKKVKDTCKVIVVAPSEGLSLKKDYFELYVGQGANISTVLATKGSNDPVFWKSSNSSVVTVDAKGKLKAVKQGAATITGTTFNGKTATAYVLVKSKAAVLEFSEITPALYIGGNTGNFTLDIKSPDDCNDNIVWTSSNKKVIEIVGSNTGKTITIKSGVKGTSTITAKTGGGKKLTYKVTAVNKAATSVTLKSYNVDVFEGKTVTLGIKQRLEKDSNDPVLWKSSDPSIATVDQNGKVKGLKQGEVDIDATTFGGVPNTVHVFVRTKATGIYIAEECPAIYMNGETDTVRIEAYPEGCNDSIKLTSSNKKIIDIAGYSPDTHTITLKSGAVGVVTITAKSSSGKTVKFTVASVDKRATEMTISTTEAETYTGDTVQLSATISPEAPYDYVVWESADPSIATVDKNGLVKGIKAGTVTIKASSRLKGVKPPKLITIKVRAKNESIKLNKYADDIYVDDTSDIQVTQITPAGSVDTITWTTSDSAVATVVPSADGMSATVTGVGAGTASIRAVGDNGDIAETIVTVRTKVTSLTLNKSAVTIYSTETFNAEVTEMLPADSNDKLTWTSEDSEIASVDQNGVITAKNAGTVVIKLTSGSGVEASITVTVKVKVTSITLNKSAIEAYVGESTTVKITEVAPADYTDSISWITDNSQIATVSASSDRLTATIKGVKPGTTIISAVSESGVKAMVVVTVKETSDNDSDWPW